LPRRRLAGRIVVTGSLRVSVAVRYALASALAAAGVLLIVASGQSRAASPSPSTCPDGYRWERLSGVGCVQIVLPAHGQYSYTSAAICSDPYMAVFAPGPNNYGSDPNTTYLVACLTAQEWAARASSPVGGATPAPGDGGGGNHGLGNGPLDELAGNLVEDGVHAPDPRDADLGGVAATGVLLLSLAGAVVAGGSGGLAGLGGAAGAGGGPGGGGGSGGSGTGGSGSGSGPGSGGAGPGGPAATGTSGSAGASAASASPYAASGAASGVPPASTVPLSTVAQTSAVGVMAAPAGFTLQMPRPELMQAGLSIFRSMKRVTEDANPDGYSPGDIAQMLGDAAGIAVLASALAPAVGLVSLASGSAAAATDVRVPQEVFDQMRRNFGRLGYMQGVLDENVSHADRQLGELDLPADAPGGVPPADPTALSARELTAARKEWAARADEAFDVLAAAQTELDELDVRRANLAHQIDSIGDLLVRIDQTGSVLLPEHLAATISYGRGWYFAGDSSKMAAALRESFARSKAAGAPRRQHAGGGEVAVAVGVDLSESKAITLGQWATANRIPDGRLAVVQALGGLERWRGFYDALAASVQERVGALRLTTDRAVAVRRDLAAEVQRRALQGPRK
jgi:hypothetical protein